MTLQDIKKDLLNDLKTTKHGASIAECLKIIDLIENKKFKELSFYQLKITKHDGKMQGIPSISTYKKYCGTCLQNQKIDGSICAKCYADKTIKQYKQMKYSLIYNTLLLAYTSLKPHQIPIFNSKYVRIESFSDLQNLQHLENIIKIIKVNKMSFFGLWTKNYNLIYNYVKDHKMPSNMNLILSSLFINCGDLLDGLRNKIINTNNIKDYQVRIFTVYDNNTEGINCGGKKCLNCGECYKKKGQIFIKELLK